MGRSLLEGAGNISVQKSGVGLGRNEREKQGKREKKGGEGRGREEGEREEEEERRGREGRDRAEFQSPRSLFVVCG